MSIRTYAPPPEIRSARFESTSIRTVPASDVAVAGPAAMTQTRTRTEAAAKAVRFTGRSLVVLRWRFPAVIPEQTRRNRVVTSPTAAASHGPRPFRAAKGRVLHGRT